MGYGDSEYFTALNILKIIKDVLYFEERGKYIAITSVYPHLIDVIREEVGKPMIELELKDNRGELVLNVKAWPNLVIWMIGGRIRIWGERSILKRLFEKLMTKNISDDVKLDVDSCLKLLDKIPIIC
ncbi:hypothetical protein DRJ17_04165 [Candidatus Woesearchaeota archaeon]|nr:MAG: hypothetical protein DRJ17_04165 [Candidatus Woesearchaeota archaeon]